MAGDLGGLAQHVELHARRVMVEEAVPIRGQVVQGARLDQIVIGEHRLAPIATLGNVVRHIRQDSPSKLCHGVIMDEARKG